MVKGSASVTAKGDTSALRKMIAGISSLEVFVGIPEETASRGDETINNAELAYIHTHGIRASAMREEMQPDLDAGRHYSKAYEMYIRTHGSPLWQSQPRPIIEPAIEKRSDEIAKELKIALQAALNADHQGALRQLHAVGQYAAGEVQEYFTDPENGWPENSPATIAAKGSAQPLIDTGNLRDSITYVVGEKK